MPTRSIKYQVPNHKWVIYLARSRRFIGLNYIGEGYHCVGYTLVKFPDAMQFTTKQAAVDLLQHIDHTKQQRKLSEQQLRRLRVRCVMVTLNIELRSKPNVRRNSRRKNHSRSSNSGSQRK
jgi:hypothetical protein